MQPGNLGEFIEKAHDDLLAANIMLREGGPPWIAGFHLQQAAEKLLKAVLISMGVNPKKTHDLVVLIQDLEDAHLPLPSELQGIDELNPFAVALRYETVSIQSGYDLMAAHALVIQLQAWAIAQMSPPTQSPE